MQHMILIVIWTTTLESGVDGTDELALWLAYLRLNIL